MDEASNAVFAVNDPSALGVISALEAAGKSTGVTVVSVVGSAQGIAAVKAGPLYSTSVQFPREIGRIAAQRFYEHLDGNSVEKYIRVPLELITAENVHAFAGKQEPETTSPFFHAAGCPCTTPTNRR